MTGRQRQPQKRSSSSPLQLWQSAGALRSASSGPLAESFVGSLLKRQSGEQLDKGKPPLLSRPLLHILDQDEQPGDMVVRPKEFALRGQRDVYIARAEIELRNAMQSLSFMTHSEINSISTLTALSLPKAIAPMFWTINAFLQGKFQRPDDLRRIHHRNHDARILFQQLAQLNLKPWSERTVDYIRPNELPDYALFPVGHPILGRTYRRHPFKSRVGHYYPASEYFTMLL